MAYMLIVLGLFGGATTGYDELYVKSSPKEQHILFGKQLVSNRDPQAFRQALNAHWFFSGILLTFGFAMHIAIRRQERLDPLSPEFDWDEEDGSKPRDSV